jgi:uncharacterized protein YlaN (UPF0358 family)
MLTANILPKIVKVQMLNISPNLGRCPVFLDAIAGSMLVLFSEIHVS